MTSASDGVARVWNDRGELTGIFNCNTGSSVMVSKWNKDSNLIASASDTQVKVWSPLMLTDSRAKVLKHESIASDLDW